MRRPRRGPQPRLAVLYVSVSCVSWSAAALKRIDVEIDARLGSASIPPDDYVSWSALDKIEWLNSTFDIGRGGSHEGAPWYAEDSRGCFNLECAYHGGRRDRNDIVSPYECRIRGAHPDGVLAWLKASWLPNNYTGMFKKAQYGFARWGWQMYNSDMFIAMKEAIMCRTNQSMCANLTNVATPPQAIGFMALKFFRDNVPSANLHTGTQADMPGPGWSFFQKVYTNLMQGVGVPFNDTTKDPSVSLAEQAALRGTLWPGFVGLHDMGMYDQEGNLEQDIKFPYQLIFTPTIGAMQLLPPTCVGSIGDVSRDATNRSHFGMPLFDIYAKDTPLAPGVKIGTLDLQSNFMVSQDIDRQGFFPHTRFDRDITLRPEFVEEGCSSYYDCPTCPQWPMFCSPDDWLKESWSKYKAGVYNFSEWLQVWADGLANNTQDLNQTDTKLDPYKDDVVYSRRSQRARALSDYQRMHTFGDSPEDQVFKAMVPLKLDEGTAPSCAGVPMLQKRDGKRAPADMRADDVDLVRPPSHEICVDQLTHIAYRNDFVCPEQQSPQSWPRVPRGFPWSPPKDCVKSLKEGNLPQEPEYEVDRNTCSRLPKCNKIDGTWFSEIYPCQCGMVVICASGQLCNTQKNGGTCIPWQALSGIGGNHTPHWHSSAPRRTSALLPVSVISIVALSLQAVFAVTG